MTEAARQVRVFPDLEALSVEAAREIVRIARESIATRGRFSVALSGGSTPKRTHQLLAEQHRGDERRQQSVSACASHARQSNRGA